METKKILLDSAAKMSYVEKVDSYLDSLKIGKSAMVDSWFMMSSPVPIMSAVVAYLLFIRIGPRLMKNQPPLKMNKLIAYYNAIQVLLAATICVKVFKLNLFRDGIVYAGCRYPSNTQNPMLLDVGWWYFFAKFTELLDTVFFVLRKKDKQVTFLHVYHHVVMALYSWSYLKFAAGGEGAILALLNSMVHVVMYTYYLMSGLGPRFQKYLWWKKYVTKMQLTQFIMMLVYCSITHFSPRCQYASGFTYFISGNVIIFLILFLNFYSKSYYKKKLAEKELKAGYELSRKIKENGDCNGNTGHDNKDVCENTNDTANGDDIALKMGEICGHYINDDNVQNITKRTPKSAYETEYVNDLKSIIKK